MGKVVSNWTLDESNVKNVDDQPRKINSIVRNTIIDPEEKVIQNFTPKKSVLEAKISEAAEVVPEKKIEPIEPLLQLIRNNEGIVIGIEVQCGCGEKIMIKMEY
jgi:hypothetical protein